METGAFWALDDVSDEQLRRGLKSLLGGSARTEARIIAHIAEVEARQLHLKDGSPSAFEYCRSQLGLSESEAFHRLTAARIVRKYPLLFAMIERRGIHLSGVCLLRDYLTPNNHLELLTEAAGKTKLQVLELLARRFPKPDVKSQIRRLPNRDNAQVAKQPSISNLAAEISRPNVPFFAARPNAHHAQVAKQPSISDRTERPNLHHAQVAQQPSISDRAERPNAPIDHNSSPVPHQPTSAPEISTPAIPYTATTSAAPAAPARAIIEPTSEARYRIQLNATSSLKEKLELLRALMSHSVPNGDLAEIVERAIEMALEQVQKQRFAKTNKPRSSRTRALRRSSTHREHIPNATQREVAARDELRCSYFSDTGCRCSSRAFLQIHHEQPWARNGESTPENLRLLCAAHNRLLAERDFGAAHVARCRDARRSPSSLESEGRAREAKAEARDPGEAPNQINRQKSPEVPGSA